MEIVKICNPDFKNINVQLLQDNHHEKFFWSHYLKLLADYYTNNF